MCATNYYQCKCISDEGEFPMKAFMTATMTAAALAAGGAFLPSAEAAGVFFADAPVVSSATTAPVATPGTRPAIYIPGQITTPYIDRDLTTDENMFFLAIEKADYNTMQLMLDKGVDINAYYRRKDTTPLGRAMYMNNRTTIQFLLERGADVQGYVFDRGENHTHSYLVAAADKGDLALVQYLHNWGADINGLSWSYGYGFYNALFTLGTSSDDLNVMRYLIAQGINVNYVTSNGGTTPLTYFAQMYISAGERQNILKMLLDAGADPAVRDASGKTAVDYCIARNDLDSARFLQTYVRQ